MDVNEALRGKALEIALRDTVTFTAFGEHTDGSHGWAITVADGQDAAAALMRIADAIDTGWPDTLRVTLNHAFTHGIQAGERHATRMWSGTYRVAVDDTDKLRAAREGYRVAAMLTTMS